MTAFLSGKNFSTITSSDIADSAIISSKIADDAVVSSKIADDAVTAAKIVAGAVSKTVNAQTGTTYTAVAGDANNIISMNNASANTVTIPANSAVSYAVGDQIEIHQFGSGTTNIELAGTINGISAPGSGTGTITAQFGSVILTNRGVDVWSASGDHGPFVFPDYMTATGGTITIDGDFKVHTFTASGTFTAENAIDMDVEYLVIAGGGGGAGNNGGGGGAGGYRTATGLTVPSGNITVTVGAGGAATVGTGVGSPGNDSVFSTITATAGGHGGAGSQQFGGSSGGGTTGQTSTAPIPTGQGNIGGAGDYTGGFNKQGGGGGGAGAVGQAAVAAYAGAGGAGLSSSITGTAVTRAGGGGGGSIDSPAGAGGSGGGGAGRTNTSARGSAATVNTGSGGGAGGQMYSGPYTVGGGGAGGSGIVILRYRFQA
jgi:hypothetical protein